MDNIDRALQKWRDGDHLTANDKYYLSLLAKESGTQRASDYRAEKAGNK